MKLLSDFADTILALCTFCFIVGGIVGACLQEWVRK
jgi:hypothetical protein